MIDIYQFFILLNFIVLMILKKFKVMQIFNMYAFITVYLLNYLTLIDDNTLKYVLLFNFNIFTLLAISDKIME
jgi:hypothetical protein